MEPGINTVAWAWAEYAERVIKEVKPESTQYWETRRAFYAAFYSAITIFLSATEPDVTEDEAVAKLEALMRECEHFVVEISAGRA